MDAARTWHAVADEGEVPEGGQIAVSLAGRRLLICRSGGRLFAISSRCSHDQEELTGGVIRKCTIVCPHHGARFSLETGMPYGPPAFDAIRTYPLQLSGARISVSLD